MPGWVLVTVMTAGLVMAIWGAGRRPAPADAQGRPRLGEELSRDRCDPAGRGERGAAVVDFVLVLVVLVPVFLGILQVALVLLVRNTLAAAASEGARYAATLDRGPADGAARTRAQIDGALAAKFAEDVGAASGHGRRRAGRRGGRPRRGAGARASAARRVELTVTGHAIEEQRREARATESGTAPWSSSSGSASCC